MHFYKSLYKILYKLFSSGLENVITSTLIVLAGGGRVYFQNYNSTVLRRVVVPLSHCQIFTLRSQYAL